MIFNMLSKAAIKTADKLSYLRSKVSFGRWDYHPRPTVEPKTQADAVVSFLNGTLSQPITQKGRETNDAFAKRQQKHMTRSLRRLMFYLVKLDGADANSQGFNTIERTSIDALIENANNDPHAALRLALLYSLIIHVMKHSTEVDNDVRLRIGRYINRSRDGQKIMRGLGIALQVEGPQPVGLHAPDTVNADKATATISVDPHSAAIYTAMETAHANNQAIADESTRVALEKYKPTGAYLFHRFGKFLAIFVSLAVFFTLLFFAKEFFLAMAIGVVATWALAVLVSSVSAYVNYRLFQHLVPDTLLDFFSFGPFSWTKPLGIGPLKFRLPYYDRKRAIKYWYTEEALDGTKTQGVKTYTKKQIALTVVSTGFVLVASGISAIFTFMGVKGLLVGLGLAAGVAAFPAAILAVVLFLVYFALFLKSYNKLIQGGSLGKTISQHADKANSQVMDYLTHKPGATFDSASTNAKRQALAVKVIYWTLFVFIFTLVNLGAIIAGFTAAFSPTGALIFGGSEIAAWSVGVGVSTAAMAGFAATSSAMFSEKMAASLFKILDKTGMTRLHPALLVPWVIIGTLIAIVTTPAWFPVYALGYGAVAYVTTVVDIINNIYDKAGVDALHPAARGFIKLLATPLLAVTSPLWLLVLTPLARIINRKRAAAKQNDALQEEGIAAHAPDVLPASPDATPTDDAPEVSAAGPDEEAAFSKKQFGLILINAVSNALQYLAPMTLLVQKWFSGASFTAQALMTGLASVPGYMMSFTALFSTTYGGGRDDYQRSGNEHHLYTALLTHATTPAAEDNVAPSPMVDATSADGKLMDTEVADARLAAVGLFAPQRSDEASDVSRENLTPVNTSRAAMFQPMTLTVSTDICQITGGPQMGLERTSDDTPGDSQV